MFAKHGPSHHWPETRMVQATALPPRQLTRALLIAGDPLLDPHQHLHHPCPVCSSGPPNHLTS